MLSVSKSIYGCTQAPDEFKAPPGTMSTYNLQPGRCVRMYWYGHWVNWCFQELIKKLNMFNSCTINSEIKYLGRENQGSNDLVLILPVKKPLVEIPVIELTLR